MKLKHRAPYIVVLGMAAGLMGLYAVEAWAARSWPNLGATAAMAVACAAAAVALGMTGAPAPLPPWAQRFELVAVKEIRLLSRDVVASVVLRCNRCDSSVIPPGTAITLPRVLSSALLHFTQACEPRRASDPESTRAMGPDRLRRASLRR